MQNVAILWPIPQLFYDYSSSVFSLCRLWTFWRPQGAICWIFNNTTNNEILIKHEPLACTRAQCAVQKKQHTQKKIERKKRLGQYNSNNELIHGQYTSRYNPHLSLSPPLSLSLSLSHLSLSLTHTHTHTHTHKHTASQMTEFTEEDGGSRGLASRGRIWTDESPRQFLMQWLTEHV